MITTGLKIKYKSRRRERTSSDENYTLVYYGSREAVETAEASAAIGEELALNGVTLEGFELESTGIEQDAGPIWQLSLSYARTFLNLATNKTEGQPNTHELNVSMINAPLKTHPNYRTCWDHYVAAVAGVGESAQYQTYTDKSVPDGEEGLAFWVKNPDSIQGKTVRVNKSTGKVWSPPAEGETDPGYDNVPLQITQERVIPCDFYLHPQYTITERGKSLAPEKCEWAGRAERGKIMTPTLGTMGVTGLEWMCYGGTISFDGKKYSAQVIYKSSPDKGGWNQKLYKDAI